MEKTLTQPSAKQQQREARLATVLRENLRKRKAQVAARTDQHSEKEAD